MPIIAASQPGAGWIAAVRPEDITIVRRASIAEGVQVGGRLVGLEDHGADLLLHAELEDVPNATLRVRVAAERRAQVQELLAGRARVTLAMPLGKIHVFESSGRRAALRMAAASDEHAAGRA